MYFMQEAGEPLSLRYVKAPFGPYAENLRQVLTRIEGQLVSGYADGGDAPDKQLELIPGAVEQATAFLQGHPETLERFLRVTDLVEGFETPFGMELLATVHWVAAHEGAAEPEATVDAVYRWNEHKRAFSEPGQIQLAREVLEAKGWLARQGSRRHGLSYVMLIGPRASCSRKGHDVPAFRSAARWDRLVGTS